MSEYYKNIDFDGLQDLNNTLVILTDHIYLKDRLHIIKRILKENPKIQLMPMSLQVSGMLYKAGITKFINYCDYITPSLIEEVMTIKSELWLKWYKQINLEFNYKGVDLFYADDTLRRWFFEDYPYLHLLLIRFFSTNDFSSVVLFCNKQIKQPEYIDTEDLIYFLLPTIQSNFMFNSYIFGVGKFIINNNSRFLAVSNQNEEVPVKNINKIKKVGIIMSGLKDADEIYEAFNNNSFTTYPMISSFCDPRNKYYNSKNSLAIGGYKHSEIPSSVRLEINQLWDEFLAQKVNITHQFIFGNPLLIPVFKLIFFERLPRLYKTAIRIDKILNNFKFDCICICDHAFPETVIASHLSEQNDTQVVIFPHSSWPIHTFPWNKSSKVVTWANMAKKQWNKINTLKEVAAIGSPRFFKPDKSENMPREANDSLKILLITNTPMYSQRPIINLNPHINSLRKLFDVPKLLNGKVQLSIKLKAHFESIDFYAMLSKHCSIEVDYYQGKELFDLIDDSDVIVGWNLLSTAHLEAISRQKPIIIVRDEQLQFYEDEPEFPDELFTPLKGEEFWDYISNILNGNICLNEVLDLQYSWLCEELPKGNYSINLLAGLNKLNIGKTK
jgi:hypothetical protein